MSNPYIFCPEDGFKNLFVEGKAPNFCSKCGYNFASLAAFGVKPKATRVVKESAVDIETSDDDDEREVTGEAGFSQADVEIDSVPVKKIQNANTSRVSDANRQTVGDFFSHPVPPMEARQPMNTRAKKASAKQAFEQYKSEAGGTGLKRQEIN